MRFRQCITALPEHLHHRWSNIHSCKRYITTSEDTCTIISWCRIFCNVLIVIEIQRRRQQLGVGGARYVCAHCAVIGTRVYSSSAFRNASSACSSNTNSIVIAPILLGGQGPPYWNIGGGGEAIAPLPPLCRCP